MTRNIFFVIFKIVNSRQSGPKPLDFSFSDNPCYNFLHFHIFPTFLSTVAKKSQGGGVEVCRCVNLWHSSFSKRQAFVLPKFALLEIILGAAAGESANKICLTSYIYKQWIVCTNLFIVPMGGQKVRTESFYSDKYDLPICTYRFWLKNNNR